MNQAQARMRIWERLSAECVQMADVGALAEEAQDEFELRRLELAAEQVKKTIDRRLQKAKI